MTFSLSQFHEDERLLARAQTLPGRLTIWVVAVLLMLWSDSSVFMPAAFTAVMLFPEQRRLVLSIAAVGALAELFAVGEESATLSELLSDWLPLLVKTAIGVLGLYLAYRVALLSRHWPAIVRRHPLVTLHVGVWIGMSLSTVSAFSALGSLPFLTWRLSYLAMSAARGGVSGTRFRDHLFYLIPVFGGGKTPLGKGLDYLSRFEATDELSVARSQLAGLKLLLLAVAWTYALQILELFVYGEISDGPARWPVTNLPGWSLHWPDIDALLRSGVEPAWYAGWLTIYLELIRKTLDLAVYGHVIIGCLRLSGFNVFRNTYKPLLAESILDFWSRYFHYFKEVLVDFLFYPMYLRARKLGHAPRMFVAVFAAAFAGNMYFHILGVSPELVVAFDYKGLWAVWSPRLVYCFLLAFGVWVSMLRQPALRASGVKASRLVRLRRIAGVWTFFSIIQIWNVRLDGVGIGDCTELFLSLFGF